MKTFYWHDYETWGINPRIDRACQFAGIRTDLDFNIIGKPLEIYSYPADDVLPSIEACLITHITPRIARKYGVIEAEFFNQIHQQLAEPNTIGLGYNTLRFDDEVTRFGFYRNFFDPYAREYKNGCGRWDIIDMTRLCHALRPEGIKWPTDQDGITSFKLEALTAANGIEHQGAHDALVDVKATIAWAKLLKTAQPRLFDYMYSLRDKNKIAALLPIKKFEPVLHVSAKYPAKLGCIASVIPLLQHPTNRNAIIVYDLRIDPTEMLSMSAEAIIERLYTRTADLAEGVQRIPLKAIHINKTPMVVPLNTINDEQRERWQMPKNAEDKHLNILKNQWGNLTKVLEKVYAPVAFDDSDPDQALYGGFISNKDRIIGDKIRQTKAEELAQFNGQFQDQKFNELLFRYRARNFPQTLNIAEQQQWQAFKDQSLAIPLKNYRQEIAKKTIDPTLSEDERLILEQLIDWLKQIGLS